MVVCVLCRNDPPFCPNNLLVHFCDLNFMFLLSRESVKGAFPNLLNTEEPLNEITFKEPWLKMTIALHWCEHIVAL